MSYTKYHNQLRDNVYYNKMVFILKEIRSSILAKCYVVCTIIIVVFEVKKTIIEAIKETNDRALELGS